MATYWATVTTPEGEQHNFGINADSHDAARSQLVELVASRFPIGTSWLLNQDPDPKT